MRRFALICLLGLSSAATMAAGGTGKMATVELKSADGKTVGTAHLMSAKDGVSVNVSVKGLAAGTHGIHLHTVGSCQAPDFASAGAHWNPGHKMHGTDNPQGSHMGDLPNLVVKADGTGELTATVKGAHLDATAMGLLDSDGSALVIHAAPDDYKTDPSGNSGGRIACGVVTES